MKYLIVLLTDARTELDRQESEHGSDVQAVVHAAQLLRSTPGASIVRVETQGALVAEIDR